MRIQFLIDLDEERDIGKIITSLPEDIQVNQELTNLFDMMKEKYQSKYEKNWVDKVVTDIWDLIEYVIPEDERKSEYEKLLKELKEISKEYN